MMGLQDAASGLQRRLGSSSSLLWATSLGFNPATLFGPTDTGWVYDLSDMSTLFQDAAGITPVADFGQPVGLCLDKSKGLVLGPELATGWLDSASGWTLDTGWSVTGGAVVGGAGANGTFASRPLTTVAGRWYLVDITVASLAGTLQFGVRQETLTGPLLAGRDIVSDTGVFSLFFLAASTTSVVRFGDFLSAVSISNISVRELPGIHRSQSASLPRPTYARHPLGGIRNLLTFTEEFENAAWNRPNTTVTANAGVAPDGTMTADNWFFNSGVPITTAALGLFTNPTAYLATTNPVLLSATAYTYSLYVKAGSGLSHIQLRAGTASNLQGTSYIALVRLSDGAVVAQSSSTCSVSSAGNGWWRIAMTFTPTANGHFFGVWGWNNTSFTTNGTQFYTLWGAQLELGSTATPYQRVGSVFDVTEAGVPDLYYLSYDGWDDNLSTAPFAWGSDKATVVAGVRKLSDAAVGIVLETSATAISNNGVILLRAPRALTPGYGFGSKGTVFAEGQVNAGFAAPISNVLTGIADISGDRATLRINGAQVAQSTADQGTGNFGTHPVFFGARGGTDLFFKGWEYSNVGISRLLTTGELAALESWTAGKAGNTL